MLTMMRMRAHLRRSIAPLRASSAALSTSSKALGTKFDVSAQQLSPTGQRYRVVFGANAARDHLGAIARASGIRKMLVVRDKDLGAASRTQYVEYLLLQAGIACFQYTLKRDCTTLEGLDDAHATALRVGADGVLAFGGGNTIDMARAVAIMMANGGEAGSYARVRSLVLQWSTNRMCVACANSLIFCMDTRVLTPPTSSQRCRTSSYRRSLVLAQRSRLSRWFSTKTLRQSSRSSWLRSPPRYVLYTQNGALHRMSGLDSLVLTVCMWLFVFAGCRL